MYHAINLYVIVSYTILWQCLVLEFSYTGRCQPRPSKHLGYVCIHADNHCMYVLASQYEYTVSIALYTLWIY